MVLVLESRGFEKLPVEVTEAELMGSRVASVVDVKDVEVEMAEVVLNEIRCPPEPTAEPSIANQVPKSTSIFIL